MRLRAVCIAATALAPTSLSANVIRTVWLSPSGAGIIRPPSVNESGRVGFTDNQSVYQLNLAGSNIVQVFATAGAPVMGGLPGDTWNTPTSNLLFDPAGRLLGRMSLAGSADGIVFGSPGQFSVLARANVHAPGYPASTNFAQGGFGLPVMNPSGLVMFQARLSADNEGVWYRQAGGATTLLLGPHMPAPGLGQGVNMYAALDPRVNGSGQFILNGYLEGAGITSSNDSVVYWGDPTNPQVLLREGTSVAGGPPLDAFYRPTIDDSGAVATWATFHTSLTDQAIIAGSPSSLMQLARTGTRGPGMSPGETWGSTLDATHFWYPVLTGSGNVVFWGQIAGGAHRGDSGLWMGDAASDLAMVIRSGSTVPGLPAGVSVLGAPREDFAANALGDVVLLASLTGSGVTSSNDVELVYWSEATGLEPLLRKGDRYQVAPNDFRTIARFELIGNAGGQDGAPICLNDRRELVWRMAFTDGSTGIFLTVVPSPSGALVLLAGMGGVVRRSRRRER